VAVALYGLAIGIVVLISAFQHSVATGFLTLCVPFYVLYFLFAQCESKLVKALYSIALLAYLLTLVLPKE
jgi:hypothetical protein